MHGAAAHRVADVVGQLFHPQRAQHHFRVRAHQRDHRFHLQEIRRRQEVGVQDVGLQRGAVDQQLAQQYGLLGDRQAQGLLGGLQRSQLVPQRADAADARGDDGRLVEAAPLEQRLEVARGLDDVELRLLQNAVLHVHDDVAVAFDAGQVLDS